MDAAEFDAFHAGTHPRLLASLSAATGNPDAAAAALDRAYARAWSRRGSLGRDEPAETWVLHQAARVAGVDPAGLPGGVPSVESVAASLASLSTRPTSPAALRRAGSARAGARRVVLAVVVLLVLAVAVVALPQVLPGRGPGGGPGPPEQLVIDPGPRPERPGEVGADFDLAAGLSTQGRTGPAYDLDPFPGWQVCGRSYDLGGLTSPGLAVRDADAGTQSGRVLVVARELDLSDAERNASGIVERYVQRFERCAGGDGGTTSVARSMVGEQAWIIVREYTSGTVEILQVVRVGTAILLSGSRDVDGDRIGLASLQRAEAYAVAPILERMCLWADDGCGT